MLEFFGRSLKTPVILKSRFTPLRDDGQRSADDLVGAVALDRLALGERPPSAPRAASVPDEQRQVDDLQEIVVGDQIVLGRRGLPVLDEYRLAAERVDAPARPAGNPS